ncbi:MAG: SUMF1/EgtB/PvdO family nonheme iron enzyme [Candidatus Competibacter sp.]|nr:SUMF1/EgtB/PvdO family nonheme iron enzyme [Candidatus Competibacter sp.]
MDIETRSKELAEAYAEGRLDEVELARRQEALLDGAADANIQPAADNLALSIVESSDPEIRAGGEGAELEILESGKVIGPADRRVRLLHDLSGEKRIWLVRAVAPMRDENDRAGEEFQAIKIFLPGGHPTITRESRREERAQRADLIGLRAYLARVRARVELATKLDHRNIACTRGWRYGADGWPFAEMEYINPRNGYTLAQQLREQGRDGFPWDIAVTWLLPVADALDYARREHRIAHQHLDADTVFVTDQGEIKLLGFGLAIEPREPRSVLFAGGGPAAGANAEGSTDPATAETTFRRDVFALALLIYQLLTGKNVYEVQGQKPNMAPRPDRLNDDAWRVLRRGLAYPSELCPTDAGPFLAALDAAQSPGAMITHRRNPILKRKWMLAAGLSLAVILSIYWLTTRVGETPEPEPSAQMAQSGETAPRLDAAPTTSGSGSAQAAEREADLHAFEAARRVDTQVAYRLYLQRCPRCGYEREARAAVQRLETADKIREFKAAFEVAAQALEREGRGDRGDAARSRLDALAALAPDDPLLTAGRLRLVLGWAALAQASLDKPDLGEARRWLKKAESLQVERPELKALAQRLEQAEAGERIKRLDADAFTAVQRVHTRKAYWSYLERCAPTCNHRAEAEAALARLAPANPVFRDRLSDGSQGPDMVVIPSGGFLMGSPPQDKGRYNDEKLHPALIETSFAIGKYEVMFHEYDRFAAATGRTLPIDQGWGRGRRPVINVSWQAAADYAQWLSQQTGRSYRLPTEAEWEYAARAGVAASRYWGDDPDQGCAYANAADLDGKQMFVGWTVMKCRDGYIYTAPAGSYRSNDFGLHDMLGNVLEWTCSLYDKDAPAPIQSCQQPAEDRQFVVRGGSWNDEPRNVRSAERHRSQANYQDYFLGFRLVRELP